MQMEKFMQSPSPKLNPKTKMIKAGAGAGKTTTLVREFMDFVLKFEEQKGELPRIVVTTFTRKATQELKERLLARAYDLGRPDLLDYIGNKNRVHISTIHGVLFSFLSKYGFLISLSGDLSVRSERELKHEKQMVFKKILNTNESLYQLLEDYEWPQLLHFLSMYFRGWMQNENFHRITVDELQQMAQEQWQNIFEKQKEIVLQILEVCDNPKWQSYLEPWRDFFQPTSVELGAAIPQLENLLSAAKKPPFMKANPPFSEDLHELFEDGRATLKKITTDPMYQKSSWELHEQKSSLLEELGDAFVGSYFDQKINSLQLSMDDLEVLSLHLVKKAPESVISFSKEWDFWMIDEYQDTSPLQEKLLSAFVAQSPAFYVGDPQQSIYLFRGAKSELFNDKLKQISASGGQTTEMMTNYRSEASVLIFFNTFFTKLNSQFSSMEPHTQVSKNVLASDQSQPIQVLISDVPESQKDAEVGATIFRIQELIQQGVRPEQICVLSRTHDLLDQVSRKAQEFEIKTQLHGSQNYNERREIQDALSLLKFLLNPHDNLNLLTVLRTPWINVSDQALSELCKPLKESKVLAQASYWQKYLTIKTQFNWAAADLKSFHFLETYLSQVKMSPISEVFVSFLIDSGMFDFCYSLDSSGKREGNLWKLVSMYRSQAKVPGFNPLKFIESLEISGDEIDGSSSVESMPVVEPQKVNLMTIHASKGLQFDYVIIPGMGKSSQRSQASFLMIDEQSSRWTVLVRAPEAQENIKSPLATKMLEELHLKEDQEIQRVLYVAMTRAKKGVSLLWSTEVSRNSWAGSFPLLTSPGLHPYEGFHYLVRQGEFQPQEQILKQQRELTISPRTLFNSKGKDESVQKTSVTHKLRTEYSSYMTSGKSFLDLFSRAQFGVNIHKKLEQMKFRIQNKVSQQSLPAKGFSSDRNVEYVLSLRSPPVLKLLQFGEVEWGFSYLEGQERIEGQVDLWGIIDGILYVVDYKTGSEKYLEKAFYQLQYYSKAILKIKKPLVKKVCLVVIFTEKEVVHEREEVIE